MSREDYKRYDAAFQKLRAEIKAKPKESHVREYLLAALGALGEWAAATYGPALLAWLISIFIFLAFIGYTKSILAQKRKLFRYGIPISVGCLLIAGTMLLTARSKTAPPPVTDLVSPVQVSRQMALLPIDIGPNSSAYIVSFRSDRTANRQIRQNPESTHYLWPIGLTEHDHKIDDIFLYQMTNQSKAPVYNARTIFRVEFSHEAGKFFAPLPTSTPELIIDRTLLAPGIPFVFFAVNQSPYFVRISAPPVMTLQLEGESRTREALLAKLVKEAPDAFPIELAPTANTWEGDQVK